MTNVLRRELAITAVKHASEQHTALSARLRQVRGLKIKALRVLFFEYQMLPREISELTGVPESTVRALCVADERYEERAAANRHRVR